MLETSNLQNQYGFFSNLQQIRQALVEMKNQINTQQQEDSIQFSQQQQLQQLQQQQFFQEKELNQYELMTKRARSVGQNFKRINGSGFSPFQSQFDNYNQENDRQHQIQTKRQNFFQEPQQFYNQQYSQNIEFDPNYSMILDQENSIDFYNYHHHQRSAPFIQQSNLFLNHSPVPRDKVYVKNNNYQQHLLAKMKGPIHGNRQIHQTNIKGANKSQMNSIIQDSNQSIRLSNSCGQINKQFQDVTMNLQNDDIIEITSNTYNTNMDPINTSQISMIVSKSFNENTLEDTQTKNIQIVKKEESHTIASQNQQQTPQQQTQQSHQQSIQPVSVSEKLEIKFLKQTIDQFNDDNSIIYKNFIDSLKVIEALKKKIQEQDIIINATYDKLKLEYIKLNHTNKTQIEQNSNLEKMLTFWKNKFEKLKESIKKGIEEDLAQSQENEKIIQQLETENSSLRDMLQISYDETLIKKIENKLDEVESDFYNNHCSKNPPPSDIEIKFMASNNKGFNKEFKKYLSVEKSFQPDNYQSLQKKNSQKQLIHDQANIIQKSPQLKQDLPNNAINQIKPVKEEEQKQDKQLNNEKNIQNVLISEKVDSKQNIKKSPKIENDQEKKNDKEIQQTSTNNSQQIMSQKDKQLFVESSNKLQNIMKQREIQKQLEEQEKIKQQQLNLLSGFEDNDENFEEDEDADDHDNDEEPVKNNNQDFSKQNEQYKSHEKQQTNQKNKNGKPESLVIESDISPEQYNLEPNNQLNYSYKVKDIGSMMSNEPKPKYLQPRSGQNIFSNTQSKGNDIEDFDEDDTLNDEDYVNEHIEKYYRIQKNDNPPKEKVDYSDRARAKELLLQQSKQLSQQMQNPKFFKSNSNEINQFSTNNETVETQLKQELSSQNNENQQQELTPQQKQKQEFIKMMQMSNSTIQKNLYNSNMYQKKDKIHNSSNERQENSEKEQQFNSKDQLKNDKIKAEDNSSLHNINSKTDQAKDEEQKQKDSDISEQRFNIQYNDEDEEEEEEEEFDDIDYQNNDEGDEEIKINSNDLVDDDDNQQENRDEEDYNLDYLETLKKQPQPNQNKRYAN